MTKTSLVTALWLVLGTGCGQASSEAQIALGPPVKSSGVTHAERLTDGRRAPSGAPWDSESASIIRSRRAFVIFDLGAVQPIEAAYIQGDNNDRFVLEVSNDGKRYSELWTAPDTGGAGLRARYATNLGGAGRFVRLRAIGGDRWISVSELQLFSQTPATWPPRPPVERHMTPSLSARLALLLFAVLALFTALGHRRGSATSRVGWIATGAAGVGAIVALAGAWPVDTAVVDLSRAVAAVVAAAAVGRLGLRRAHAQGAALTGLLAAMAILSVSAFYNFGYPQFDDVGEGRPTYVHTWDLRVYFPAAKYFDELGYDGVYLASVKAYADAKLDGSLDSIQSVELRDLRDYEMRRVSELEDEIHAVKERFSTERWQELERDMAYFWNAMGTRSYWQSLRDHGGNATPAWMLVAHLLFGDAEASESTFLRAALLDPLLLLLLSLVIWRTFGLRSALVCLVAFGATTVYQFGSNWGGSTLRNDWMVLIGLGVCALYSRRWFVGGALLGWAAMIRAFPALALVFLAAPLGWRAFRAWRSRESDRRAAALAELQPLLRVGFGAIAIAITLGALSASQFGFDESWGAWSRKMAIHANVPSVNHLGLTALVSFDPDNLGDRLRERGQDPELWRALTAQTMKDRRWITFAGMALYTWLALLACRRLRPSDGATIGTMLIPIYFYPSNYYLHVLFLWPLMLAGQRTEGREREWTWVALTVLVACAVQSFGWLIPGKYGQFLFWSGVLLVAIAVLLLIPISSDRRTRRLERSAASLS